MTDTVKQASTETELPPGLNAVIRDGLASQAMATLTGGALLGAFALKLGASNLMIGLLAAIPPLAQLIRSPGREMAIQTLSLQQWDFFLFLAFLIGLYSLHRLAMVKEVGEIEEKIVVHELSSEVRRRIIDVSTVGGLRQMVNFPFLVVKQISGVKPPVSARTERRELAIEGLTPFPARTRLTSLLSEREDLRGMLQAP